MTQPYKATHFYQKKDINIIDYRLYEFNNALFRGPQPDDKANSITYIGAAQTFGRFCKNPFPNILGNKLNLGTLNFGTGGRGPAYFLKNKPILYESNKSKIAVIQIMSGRSVGNSVYDSDNSSGIRLSDGKKMKAIHVYRDLINGVDERGLNRKFIENLVKETRERYIDEMIALLQAIKIPKILLWFSVRYPEYKEIYPNRFKQILSRRLGRFRQSPHCLLSYFPHLVNREMVDTIKQYSDSYVECTTNAGLPQVLTDFQGRVVGQNTYYPSPEMHIQAAELLYPVCRSILNHSR